MRTGVAQGDDAHTAFFGGPIRSDKEFVARIHPDDRSTVIAMLARCLEEGADFVLDYRILLPNGSVRWLSDQGRAFRDADGKPLYMTGAVVDITERKRAEVALREHEELLSLATVGANLIAFRWNVRTGEVRLSGRVEALTGLPPGTTVSSYRDKLKSVHPDDRARFDDAIARALQDGVYEAEYRHIRTDRTVVWLYDKGLVHRDDAGQPLELIGVSMDVTGRKAAEQRQALLAAELDHRAKNMLALVLALLRTTRAASVPEFVKAVHGRIRALARAHVLLSESRWAGADLRRLVEEELAPFRTREEARVRMSGPAVMLAAPAAQALGMALHELATNAVKYGALSAPAGRIEVAWTLERQGLVLRWAETGGPPASPPVRRGTGTTVIEKSITYQLNGAVEFAWNLEGLACEMVVPIEKVARASMRDMARGSP
jgi:two-component sensor histidine kinase